MYNFVTLFVMFLLNVKKFLKNLLIQLNVESYFIKLMCIQDHIPLHSSAYLVLHLAPKPYETFRMDAPCAF